MLFVSWKSGQPCLDQLCCCRWGRIGQAGKVEHDYKRRILRKQKMNLKKTLQPPRAYILTCFEISSEELSEVKDQVDPVWKSKCMELRIKYSNWDPPTTSKYGKNKLKLQIALRWAPSGLEMVEVFLSPEILYDPLCIHAPWQSVQAFWNQICSETVCVLLLSVLLIALVHRLASIWYNGCCIRQEKWSNTEMFFMNT